MFEKFIPVILRHEGGYVNDKNDAGGETKFGISKMAYPNLDIRNLTIEQAKSIYKRDYYDRLKLDQINNDLLALHIFDFAVNAGNSRAIKHLQAVVGVHVDGVIGKDTISAANSGDFSKKYIDARLSYYRSIGVGRNAKFLKGWINRVSDTKL